MDDDLQFPMHNFIFCGIYDTHKNEICNFQGSKATLRTLRRIIPQTKHCEHYDRNDHTIEECYSITSIVTGERPY